MKKLHLNKVEGTVQKNFENQVKEIVRQEVASYVTDKIAKALNRHLFFDKHRLLFEATRKNLKK